MVCRGGGCAARRWSRLKKNNLIRNENVAAGIVQREDGMCWIVEGFFIDCQKNDMVWRGISDVFVREKSGVKNLNKIFCICS